MDINLRMRDINQTSILLIVFALIVSRQYAHGLSCYVCHSTSSSSSCITNPNSFNHTCNQKYCTIYRRELTEPTGILTAFYRGCENNPAYLNTKVSTPFAVTYYRACTSDHCNIGDGKTEVTSTTLVLETAGDSLVVPGLGAMNNAFSLHTGTVCAFGLIIVAYFLVAYYE